MPTRRQVPDPLNHLDGFYVLMHIKTNRSEQAKLESLPDCVAKLPSGRGDASPTNPNKPHPRLNDRGVLQRCNVSSGALPIITDFERIY